MTREELKKLRKALPNGAKTILAEKFKLSEGHIGQILLGNRKNDMVLIFAAEMVEEHLRKIDKATQFVQNL